jgi:hypothetical protein
MELEANLNSRRCYRTVEQKREYEKEYRENNTEKIKEYLKEYRENNAEKMKEHMKEYYENNAEKIKEQMKEYYENNAEKIKEQKNTKCNCECGGTYTRQNKSLHLKTDKHKKYLEQIKDI